MKQLIMIHFMVFEKAKNPVDYFRELFKALNPISYKIICMRNIDQKEWKKCEIDCPSDHLKDLMVSNANLLKKYVNKYGAISKSKFGIVASHCAWLIVQHADHDIEFQRKYLKLMHQNPKDFRKENIKMLTRRFQNKGIEI